MTRVAICIPSTGLSRIEFTESLANLVAYSRAIESKIFVRQGSSIATNRWGLWKDAKEWGASHLFFIDEDMVFNRSILTQLLARNLWSVGANYPMRSDEMSFTAMSLNPPERIITDLKKTGVEECLYIPSGCSLTKMEYYDKMSMPLWNMEWSEKGRGYTTEDFYFYEKALDELGLHPFVDHDVSRQVAHVGSRAYKWLETLAAHQKR